MPPSRALIWLRRDLRLEDHSPLAHAEALGWPAALCFIFDETILKGLPKTDRRVSFFHAALEEVDAELSKHGTRLVVRVGNPVKEIPALASQLQVSTVVAGRDYELAAIARDKAVEQELQKKGITLTLVKDQAIFDQKEILNGSREPYKVFTAYKNNWLSKLSKSDHEKRGVRLPKFIPKSELKESQWNLKTLGFVPTKSWIEPGATAASAQLRSFSKKISEYKNSRDLPAVNGTSGLSAHLRFGTISIRACVREAIKHSNVGADTWLSELIWRDFYMMVLDQFPHVGRGKAFREQYDKIRWPGSEAHFEAWCEGRTGFPLVDAAMRHFNETGWMHNRLRMVVASFLVKDLLVDWRKGEAYFARGLLDFDFAANNGGWQWSASTGCDAQPYFRIFNPISQSKRFDPTGEFIRANMPELKALDKKEIHEPIDPIVDHSKQRLKALALFNG